MRTTLELPDTLFARLKARAANPANIALQRSALDLPRLEGALMISPDQLSNAGLFELIKP
ncbi:hypothetical protein KBY93_14285 [Synechococcus sp. J7-Johnson]|uniref:hypothetical protein n=1 Tax=Synechococcus sp. J7-Johnson TaxID=2823737 RepID=UPI0020CF810B|nr:hypothetical protein [Synechococcus sp. J7-Johnson]MCP9841791.1 hypothetical protein [Synechococcus sp. J7-Johnson]